MKKYFIENDEVIHTESPRQSVTELSLDSWFDNNCTDEEYMKILPNTTKFLPALI